MPLKSTLRIWAPIIRNKSHINKNKSSIRFNGTWTNIHKFFEPGLPCDLGVKTLYWRNLSNKGDPVYHISKIFHIFRKQSWNTTCCGVFLTNSEYLEMWSDIVLSVSYISSAKSNIKRKLRNEIVKMYANYSKQLHGHDLLSLNLMNY